MAWDGQLTSDLFIALVDLNRLPRTLPGSGSDVFGWCVRNTHGSLGSWAVAGGSGSLPGPGCPWSSAFIAGSASDS